MKSWKTSSMAAANLGSLPRQTNPLGPMALKDSPVSGSADQTFRRFSDMLDFNVGEI